MPLDAARAAEVKAFFDKNGYFAPIPVLTAEEAADLRRRTEAFERAHPDKVGLYDMKANLLFPWLDALTRKASLLDTVEAILGPDLLCDNVCFRNKAPDRKTYVSWHQDTPYIHIDPIVTSTWIPLTPATKQNGCMRVIPGSHNWPRMRHAEKADPFNMLTRGHYIDEPFDDSAAVDVELEPGQALIIHYNLVHASNPNHSDDRRMAILVDNVPASATKRGARESAMLVRGEDRWGNFDHEAPPAGEFGPAELEAHRKAVELVTATFYAGSGRVPEALSGKPRYSVG